MRVKATFTIAVKSDIKKDCLTRDSSSLDWIYKIQLRISWLIVIFNAKPPSSALRALQALQALQGLV